MVVAVGSRLGFTPAYRPVFANPPEMRRASRCFDCGQASVEALIRPVPTKNRRVQPDVCEAR